MAAAALALYCVWLALTFGVRIALQVRRTGSTGVHGVARGASRLEWLAGALLVTGLATAAAAPALALLDVLGPIPTLDGDAGHAIGVALAGGGIALTFGAQLAMGDS